MLRLLGLGWCLLLSSTGFAITKAVPQVATAAVCAPLIANVDGPLAHVPSPDLEKAIQVLSTYLEEVLGDPALDSDSWMYFYSSPALVEVILQSLAELETSGDSHYSYRKLDKTFLHDLAASLFPELEEDMSPRAVRHQAIERFFAMLGHKVAAAAKTLHSTATADNLDKLEDLRVFTLSRIERGMNARVLRDIMTHLAELLPTEADDCWRVRDFYSMGHHAWGANTFQLEETREWIRTIADAIPTLELEERLLAAGCSPSFMPLLVGNAPDVAELAILARWPISSHP